MVGNKRVRRAERAGPSRRSVLIGAALSTATLLMPLHRTSAAASPAAQYHLRAAPGRVALLGNGRPDTEVWCYGGVVPGPELRVRQGARFQIEVENGLSQETTVHWHGIRLPNAMDGVPNLTQAAIPPGGTFEYAFDLPDAGTYWYHPHARSFEQVGRGLYGALIVEENEPPPVDRDLCWVLGDWRLRDEARISEDFGNGHDASHDGRVGNTVTVNGRVAPAIQVRAGERLRLRLINAANARIFALAFGQHRPWIIALDGHPVEPHEPDQGLVVMGPGQRTDLIVDMGG